MDCKKALLKTLPHLFKSCTSHNSGMVPGRNATMAPPHLCRNLAITPLLCSSQSPWMFHETQSMDDWILQSHFLSYLWAFPLLGCRVISLSSSPDNSGENPPPPTLLHFSFPSLHIFYCCICHQGSLHIFPSLLTSTCLSAQPGTLHLQCLWTVFPPHSHPRPCAPPHLSFSTFLCWTTAFCIRGYSWS